MSVVHTFINLLTCIQVLHQRTLLPEEIHKQSKFRFRAQGLGFGDGVFHGVHSHLEFFVRSCNKLLPTMSLLRHHNKFYTNIQIESIHNRNSQRALQRNSIHFGTGYFYKKKKWTDDKISIFLNDFLILKFWYQYSEDLWNVKKNQKINKNIK